MLITIGLLAVGAGAMSALSSSMDRTESSVRHLIAAIAPPKDHVLAAERASIQAQAAMAAAVAATGDLRSQLLTDAITGDQAMSASWTKYRATAVGLPGEKRLAERYELDQQASTDVASVALIPIINSTVPGTLSQAVIDGNERVRADLVALHEMYRDEDARSLAVIEDQGGSAHSLLNAGGFVGAGVLLVGMVIGVRRAGRAETGRAERSDSAELAAFETRLRRALELVDTDTAAFAVADRALHKVLPATAISLLVADSSRARFVAVSDAPVCGVTSPEDCPALRSGTTTTFTDSEEIDACPSLAANTDRRCSATCVPIAVAGRGSAVLHLVGPVGDPPESRGATAMVARGLGDRVTLLQALATFQLQAERDPLTGLLNRRSLETAMATVIAGGQQYSVVFGDLDHFKQLNDLHGHEAGDRALRAFARTLTDSLRPQDITCRWGGEEFLIVLPSCDVDAAVEAMDRLRTNLAFGSIAGESTAVTASFGVAHSTDGSSFDEIVERADGALRTAKESGRDRVVRYSSQTRPADEPVPAGDVAESDRPSLTEA